MFTAQKVACVWFSIARADANGGVACGNGGEYVQASPPSTIVFPRPSARLTTPSSGLATPER